MCDNFEKDKLITENDINIEDIQIDEEILNKEVNRLVQSRYEKMRKRASKKALKDRFGDEQINSKRRRHYKKTLKYKQDFQNYIELEKEYILLREALKGSGKLLEQIRGNAKNNVLNREVKSLIEGHNKRAKKYIRDEKIRRQKEMMLTKIPKRYRDLYPLAREIKRQFILHVGPTNSGKTYGAMEELAKAASGVYLAPLRLLAYENYEKLTVENIKASMITGEEEIITPGAVVTCSTIEMLNLNERYEVAVIDEAQMIADRDRGGAWTQAILGVCADKVHVCLAEQALNIILKLIEECEDSYEIVRHERMTELQLEKKAFSFPEDVKDGDALIMFSRRDVLACAAELNSYGIECSLIYGNLPYDVRHREASRFMNGDTKVVVATDAIGMGMNLPIKRVVFLRIEKFDGVSIRRLMASEVLQIAGRAGRYGMYDIGYVASISPQYIEKELNTTVPDIRNAIMNIPPHLIEACNAYSELLKRWSEIRPIKGYVRSDIETKIRLAKKLEAESDNKYLVSEFVNIPFDTNTRGLEKFWYELFMAHKTGEMDYVVELLNELLEKKTPDKLEEWERRYKKLDLAFSYCKKFGVEKGIKPILEEKSAVAERINCILMEKGYEGKKCKRCGKKLSMFFSGNICTECSSILEEMAIRIIS